MTGEKNKQDINGIELYAIQNNCLGLKNCLDVHLILHKHSSKSNRKVMNRNCNVMWVTVVAKYKVKMEVALFICAQ